jgi:uncharacterized protein (TIGR00251 family)
MLSMRAVDGGVQLSVRAQPKASRDRVVGLHGDALKVAVTAPPTGGKANRAIAKVLAKALGVRASAVAVVAGHASRDKTVRVLGLSLEDASQRLAALDQGQPQR